MEEKKFLKEKKAIVHKNSLKSVFSLVVDEIGKKVFGEFWTLKDLAQNLWGNHKEKVFYEYLNSIGTKIATEDLQEQDIERFLKNLKSEKNQEYLTAIIDSVFFSKSKFSRILLGHITAKMFPNNELDYIDLTLVIALKDLYDTDLQIFENLFSIPSNTSPENVVYLTNYKTEERIVAEKLQNLNIFGRDRLSRLADNNSPPLIYEKTEVSKRLYEYIMLYKN